jgi:hypothetical protein
MNASPDLPRPESDPLAQHWAKRLKHARTHWAKWHRRIAHNRRLVAGFDWTQDPSSADCLMHRANLIFSTMSAILPHVYARNPEISITPHGVQPHLTLFCRTLETVTNHALEGAHLKQRAKAAVWAAMTSHLGIVKVLMSPQSDTPASLGLVIDRVPAEHLFIDPSIEDFHDLLHADWMAHLVPMKREEAQARYHVDFSHATPYQASSRPPQPSNSHLAMPITVDDEADAQICVIEIWDKPRQQVYTLAEGCDFWLREPYTPSPVGTRWYPFFLLPFSTVEGHFIGPCLVDLTEKLQQEYHDTRNKFAAHRELNQPHWLVSTETPAQTIQRHTDAALGEVVLLETHGLPLNQVIQPGQNLPINPSDYDTTPIRQDWEQVTGLQDAARSTVQTPKTATEASILQQALSGRVAEFRDRIEDWLKDLAQYAAQLLLQSLTPEQVEQVCGPPQIETQVINGQSVPISVPRYDWPTLQREALTPFIQLDIRAGTTGAPDKLMLQENWIKALPIIQPLITQAMQRKAQGGEAGPLEALLRETLRRFDERLDIEPFLAQAPAPAPAPGPISPTPLNPSPDGV